MGKKKVAIAISDWLLDELDAAAGLAGMSRSAMVEEAVADYVVRRRARESEAAFQRAASIALEGMELFAAEYDADPGVSLEPSSLEKLRAVRAEGRGIGA